MLKKSFMWLAAVAVFSLVSCVDDNLTEPLNNQIIKELPALDEQLASVEASAKDIKALHAALGEYDMELSKAVKAVDEHVALLKKGVSVETGTLATLELQKLLAGHVGAAEAAFRSNEGLARCFATVESGVKTWLGEPFAFYYPVAEAQARVDAVVAGFDKEISRQLLYVEALLSDVEAGLRKDERPEELTALAAAVAENSKAVETLASETSSLATEMETGYRTALQAAVSNPSEFDAEALSTLNSTAEVEEVDNSLTGLIARIESCEEQLADIIERLGVLEENMAGLLELIQSVTFMSSTSSDKACAYYNLVSTKFTEEGYMYRQPVESLELSYVVRPAASSAALTDEGLWNQGLKVLGYYAGRIEQAAVSAQNFEDFEITGVTADQLTGIVTVTVKNTLSGDFYFKKTGAKMALSVATGKTDLTSKFVEVVPMDKTGNVYIETLSLSTDYVEVDRDLTYQLRATLAPEDATEQTLVWTSSSDEIAVVSGNGLVTAKAVGEAVITVTTKGINEWGQTLSKSCRVKVLPNIKLVAPTSVEVGGTLTIRVDSPDYIDPQYINWSSSNTTYATVNDEGVVSGNLMSYNTDTKTYDEVYITCRIGDYNPLVLTHTIRVVAVQPKGVRIPGLADDVSQKSIKIGEEFSLGGTIIPDKAAENFRIGYVAAGGGNSAVADIDFSTGDISAKSPGSVTFIAQVQDKSDTKYYYPVGSEVWRFVTINVEPYWVTGVTMADTEVGVGASTVITPQFTSDADDVPPTFRTLKWESLNPEIATVDQDGTVTGVKGGTATIRVTTSDEWAVPSGSSPVTATCSVSVTAPWKEFEVGHYLLNNNGEIEFASAVTESNKSKIIGVVISKKDASATDSRLPDGCIHGLALALGEGSGNWWNTSPTAEPYRLYQWATANGYDSTLGLSFNYQSQAPYRTELGTKFMGCNNTEAMKAFISANGLSSGILTALANYTVSRPTGTSSWYIPSVAEMDAVHACYSTLATALANAGGTALSDEAYWTTSDIDTSSSFAGEVNPVTGVLTSIKQKYDSLKVRFILAF